MARLPPTFPIERREREVREARQNGARQAELSIIHVRPGSTSPLNIVHASTGPTVGQDESPERTELGDQGTPSDIQLQLNLFFERQDEFNQRNERTLEEGSRKERETSKRLPKTSTVR